MRLSVNGEIRELPGRASVADVIGALAPKTTRGIAVAVNGTVVPRAGWPDTELHDGDAVEVLTAVQGG